MSNLLSASEIVALQLPGLPTTKVAIAAKAARESWYFEERTGLGGTRKVYALPGQYMPKPRGMGERLEQVVSLYPDRVNAAEVAGVSIQLLRRIITEESDPPLQAVLNLARPMGISLDWIVSGEGDMYETPPRAAVEAPANPNSNMVAFTLAGTDVQMAFSRHWIKQQLQVSAESLELMQVPGDSMEGTLSSRDVVLVNKADTQPANGLFVLRLDGVLDVKRLQRLPGSKLKVSGSNEAYDPFELDLTQATPGFEIVGKLVWYGRIV
ncbi:LexA family transcriptional regulator [Aquitalea sp. LB_tupeE]|uniref:LexA family transcriptional regulator n=1 Tax=Aquitalea sp. LB_tupeE TaxID=2748078 RepID=UPI0015BD324D|nr:hypothetical protein [Aquitalea sp. LB_tupeE]